MLLARARPPRGIGALTRPDSAGMLMLPICRPKPTELSHLVLLTAMINTHTRVQLEASDQMNSGSMTWVAMWASGLRIATTTPTPMLPLTVARLRPACRNSKTRGSCGVGGGTRFLLGYAPRRGILKCHHFVRTPSGFVLPKLNEGVAA